MFCRSSLFAIAGLSALLGACAAEDSSNTAQSTRGASYTTFDREEDGCHPGSQNGINCNHYDCQDHVFMTGGPNRRRGGNTLEDGEYYFAVLAPGHQNGGAADGSVGNLSDNVANGGTDTGMGDLWTARRFRMTGGVLTNLGTHDLGESPNGQPIVRVAPFDETPNPGGVYILAVCPVRNGVPSANPADCKFDAFKTERCGETPPPPCQETCDEGDKECVECPKCHEECDPKDTDCVVCEPQCDPKCDPHDCATCTPCI